MFNSPRGKKGPDITIHSDLLEMTATSADQNEMLLLRAHCCTCRCTHRHMVLFCFPHQTCQPAGGVLCDGDLAHRIYLTKLARKDRPKLGLGHDEKKQSSKSSGWLVTYYNYYCCTNLYFKFTVLKRVDIWTRL